MEHLLTISGTNNKASYSTTVIAKHIARLLCDKYDLQEGKILDLSTERIEDCIGCGRCFSHGYCPLDTDDNMKDIRASIECADFIAIVVPVYGYNIPGKMKTLIDRIISWCHTLRLSGKKFLVYVVTHRSGGDYVCNYVSNVFSLMGAQLVGYGVCNSVEAEESMCSLAEFFLHRSIQFVRELDIDSYFNQENLNNHFINLKSELRNAIDKNTVSYETEYLKRAGIQSYMSFSEWQKSRSEDALRKEGED